ncbi:MAG: heterodisulfide reductase subunit A-like protein [Zestosphaera sp.]
MKGLVVCVCQGTCPSFSKLNIFELVNKLRREKKVDFVLIHPQLCASDGDNLWRVLLARGNISKLVVAGCAPEMQKKMFGWVFKELNFDESLFIPVEIRNMTTEEALQSIEKALEQ